MTNSTAPAAFDFPHWKPKFFAIWSGQAISLFGSRIVQFALVWWLTTKTGSATILATASLVALIPEIVLMPIAGVYIDRWNRRRVMIVADALIALASLWLAFMFWRDSVQVWHIYLIMVIRSIGGAFHWPAMQASTSLMVPKEHLTRVAGMNQTLFGVLGIFGPPLGALCMEFFKLHTVMLIDVGTALTAILPLLFVIIPQPKRTDIEEGAPHPSMWVDLRFGLRYVVTWRGLALLIGMALLFKVALTPAFTLFALLVKDVFNGGAVQFSLVETFMGVGMLAGGILLSVWGGFKGKHGRILTALPSLALSGAFLVIIGFTPGTAFWLLLLCCFLVGLFLPLVDGPFMAVLQSSVDPEVQGRVFTMVGSLLNLSGPVGLALAGPVSDALGVQVWYVIAGLLTAASAIGMLLMPDVRNIEQKNP